MKTVTYGSGGHSGHLLIYCPLRRLLSPLCRIDLRLNFLMVSQRQSLTRGGQFSAKNTRRRDLGCSLIRTQLHVTKLLVRSRGTSVIWAKAT